MDMTKLDAALGAATKLSTRMDALERGDAEIDGLERDIERLERLIKAGEDSPKAKSELERLKNRHSELSKQSGRGDATNYDKMGFSRSELEGETLGYLRNQLSLLKGDLREAKSDGDKRAVTSIERQITMIEDVMKNKRA